MRSVDLSDRVNMDKDKGGSGGSILAASGIILEHAGTLLGQAAVQVGMNALMFSNPVTAACQGIKFAVKLVKCATIAGIGTCAHPANSQTAVLVVLIGASRHPCAPSNRHQPLHERA
jgi:hypothetical protein